MGAYWASTKGLTLIPNSPTIFLVSPSSTQWRNDRLLAANISKSEQLMPVKKLDDWGSKSE